MKKLIIIALIVFSPLSSMAEFNKGSVLSSEHGRFAFGQISEFRQDQYMLDTTTGELWIIVQDPNKNRVLIPIPYQYGVDKFLLSPVPPFPHPASEKKKK